MPQTLSVDINVFLVAACAAIYSFWSNSRRLEYATHPLWQFVLNDICNCAFPRLWVSPQWAIYRSPNDSDSTKDILAGLDAGVTVDDEQHEPDIGSKTLKDAKATGVVPDFVIMMPIFPKQLSGPFSGFDTPIDAILCQPPFFKDNEHWYDFVPTTRLSHTLVPLLNELKRPPTRSAKNILDYAKSIRGCIDRAQDQLGDQVFCLFSSVKYAEHHTAFLLAGAGEFWSFTCVTRAFVAEMFGASIFNLEAYRGIHLDVEEHADMLADAEEAEHEVDESGNAPVFMDQVKRLGAAYMEEKAKRDKGHAARVEAQRRARAKRAHNWAQRALPVYSEFVAGQSGSGPFTDFELESLSYYVATGECTDAALSKFRFGLGKVDEPADFTGRTWSPILRLGTPDSRTCMDYIKAELKSAAEKQAF